MKDRGNSRHKAAEEVQVYGVNGVMAAAGQRTEGSWHADTRANSLTHFLPSF